MARSWMAASWVIVAPLLGAIAIVACAGREEPPPTVVGVAIENVHVISPGILTGGQPVGNAGFDALKALGVKTIITVDGATPDVAAAEARGMRYVHIPTTYATVTTAQQLEIARAIRDLPGPVFVHCHHGKHRGPAAAAAAAVALGAISAGEGVAYMKRAGTAPNYSGLYACVAAAVAVAAADIDAAPGDFPTVRKPAGIVAAMVEVDHAFEALGRVQKAGWVVPTDEPDLVPEALAGMMADHLRTSGEDANVAGWQRDFFSKLECSVKHATTLEDLIARNAKKADLDAAFSTVAASCKDCHAAYRDKR